MRRQRLIALITAGVILLISDLTAQIPAELSYQGMIENKTGSVNLVFRLYETSVGGNLLWSESHNNVQLDNSGTFSVILGSTTPLTPLAFDRPYWLEIGVDGNVMTPRTKMVSSPYAVRADIADGIADGAISPSSLGGSGTPADGNVLSFDAASNSFRWIPVGSSGGGSIVGLDEGDGIIITKPTGPVPSIGIAAKGVTTGMLADSSVTRAKIARLSIDSNAIVNGSITQAKFAPNVGLPMVGFAGGVLTGNYPNPGLGDTVVKGINIAPNSVSGSKIVDSTVTSSDIAFGAIAGPQINTQAQVRIKSVAADSVRSAHMVGDGSNSTGVILAITGRSTGPNTLVSVKDSAGVNTLLSVRENMTVGIGTPAPTAGLEIVRAGNPGLYVRQGGTTLSHVGLNAGGAINIPANTSVVEIRPDGVPASPNVTTLPAGFASGEVLYLINRDNDPLVLTGTAPVPAGATAMFIYLTSIAGWVRMF